MQDSLYWLYGGVLVLYCEISHIYITGGVFFLSLHLCYGIALIVTHDVCVIFFFEKLTHIVVKETSLGHFKPWLMLAINEKFILIFTVVCH